MSARRGGLILFLGNGAGFFLRFLRNIAIARLISVEDYGIASTFVVAMSFVQMSTDLNFRMLVVQNKDGGTPDFIAAIQFLNAIRGVLVGLILFLTAAPIAALMGQADLVWAYRAMAIVPIVGGFQHSDLDRFQRSMRFAPMIFTQMSTLGITLVLVWPLAIWLGDFRVMLAIYIIEAGIRMVATQYVAERPFRLKWDRVVSIRALRFGWPLLLSGGLLFAALQGDRIIVANQFGAVQLGLFSAALGLTMPPSMQVAQFVRTFFLPTLSRTQDDSAEFSRFALLALQSTLCLTMVGVIGFILFGPPVLVFIFGEKYAAAGSMVGLVGTIFALRIMRSGASTIAIARGHTINMLVINLVRIGFVPLAVLVAIQGGTIVDMLGVSLLGEVVAAASAVLMLRWQTKVQGLGSMSLPYLFAGTSLLLMIMSVWTSPGNLAEPDWFSIPGIIFAISLVVSCRAMHREIIRQIPI